MSDFPDFERFDYDDAWALGADFVSHCRGEGLPVVIRIELGEYQVFQAGLPGSSAMNARWAERKANIARHFAMSSQEVSDRYGAIEGFYSIFGLDQSRYAAAGGAILITVAGSIVGVLAVSGLEVGSDHDLAVEALERYRGSQGALRPVELDPVAIELD